MRPCIEFEYPEFSGCYALVRAGRVVYVGQSKSVLQRLSGHRNRLRRFKAGKMLNGRGESKVIIEFDRVKVYPCPRDGLDALENELILLYDPELNIRKPPHRKVDINYLVAKAGYDIEEWRRRGTTETYSPKRSSMFRRV